MSSTTMTIASRRALIGGASAALAAYLVFHFVAWGLVGTWFGTAPPSDNLEELMFAQSLQWTTHKHPPVATWIMWALTKVFGYSVPLTYFAGAGCAAISLWLLYRLGLHFTTPVRAAAAALAASLIAYLNYLSLQFNNNTAQLPFIAGTVLCFWLALQQQRARDWLLLGVVAGLAFLTKYSAVMTFAAGALFIAVEPRYWNRKTVQGIGLASFAGLIVIGGHLLTTRSDGESAVQYATAMLFLEHESFAARLFNLQSFVSAQLGRMLLTLLLALALYLLARRSLPSAAPAQSAPLDRTQHRFLLIFSLGPSLFAMLFAIFSGAQLLSSWATTFIITIPLWLFVHLKLRDDHRLLNGAMLMTVLLQLAVLGLVAVREGACSNPMRAYRCAPVDVTNVVPALEKIWHSNSDTPLRYVATDIRQGGLLTAAAREKFAAYPEADPRFGRWLDPADIRRCGVLFWVNIAPDNPLWNAQPDALREGFEHAGRSGYVDVPGVSRGQSARFYWAFQAPQDAAHCTGWSSP